MRRATARRLRPRRIDRRIPLLDVDNLACFVDHESGSIRHTGIRQQYAVIGRYLAFGEIAQQGDCTLFWIANSLCEGVLSVLIPKTFVSDASNFAIPDWYASISFVQPPVKAAGKKARTTLWVPRKSLSFTLGPVVAFRVKSGAMSPSFRWVLGGCWPWAKRPVATSAPKARLRIVMNLPSRVSWAYHTPVA